MTIQRERAETLLSAVRDKRVAVVGDCMLDVYLSGAVGRVSPEAPVPVLQVADERSAPGGAANVAAGLSALGARCELVGVVGDDAAADVLRARLREVGVRSDRLVVDAYRPTTTKTRVLAQHHHIVRLDREVEEEVADEVVEHLNAQIDGLVGSVDAVVLQDYNKGVLVPGVIRKAIDIARGHAVPTIADPKFNRFFEYSGVHLFKPNASELAAAMGLPSAPRDRDGLREARERIGCAFLLITLGEEGMIFFGPDDSLQRIPAVARDVYDISGAGDTVTAVAAACIAAGGTELEAAVIANYAAGVEVSKLGVVSVDPDEILAALGRGSGEEATWK